MQKLIEQTLLSYIKKEHPNILLELEVSGSLSTYLEEQVQAVETIWQTMQQENQPAYMIEAACMEVLVSVLGPSKYRYINNILEAEFKENYQQLQQSGLLQYEIINLIEHCQEDFDEQGFSEVIEDSKSLQYAIIGGIAIYFE